MAVDQIDEAIVKSQHLANMTLHRIEEFLFG